ncbi:mannitol dehydrogenase family protein [Granulicoccus sp. GXG6511]|uniref:mannitol dehydrogenase family protein n=1 Tax=Granulicoccus sp. GXG6511 TaxID=3381351 RepID=UPI003D7EB979
MTARLSRADTRPAAPVRMLHLGLGNFHRAHQAWFTEHAPDADEWGYAEFAGRDSALVDDLNDQGGAYTLLVRGADGDQAEVIGVISAVHQATDHEAWLGYWAAPELAVITITVTEAGYCRGEDGGLDLADPGVLADLEALRTDRRALVGTAPARLLAGILARAEAGGGPVAVFSCDNLPDNGLVAQRVVGDLAEALGPDAVAAVEPHAWVTSMVDRITPRATDEELAAVASLTDRDDRAPVVTEPFVEWVVAGDFPAGRPDWQGVTFVDEVEPFEQRKLWLLNGSHSLMAYAASARGHEAVSDAIGDPVVREWVEEWWDEAVRHLTLPADHLASYRAALVARFANPNIRHLLAQIAADGSQKVPVRILPTLKAERAAGRSGRGAARVVAAWIRHLRGAGAPVTDAAGGRFVTVVQMEGAEGVRRVLELLDPELGEDADVVALVDSLVAELAGA